MPVVACCLRAAVRRLMRLVQVAALLGPATLSAAEPPVLVIPRVNRTPALEDFLGMQPSAAMEGQMAKVEGFIQQTPSDGQPSSQRTEVHVGYDDKRLYVVFVAFDSEPGKVRARMARRENISDQDDWVEVALDTFHDQRRGYLFDSNPLGVQWDALWSEADGEDSSFDTLWASRGQVTPQGYVVWMAIPFKSLRFPPAAGQTWGLIFTRWIPRVPEKSTWPHVSSRIQGRLNQAAVLRGLEEISPGRNFQFIPYAAFRSFHALDLRDPLAPRFVRERAELDAGLDAKFVFRDSLVLDVTLNPDFGQVESDEPQVSVNQRFEVFFPEKRPFFIENASFFQTPINLLFTRRLANPQFGVRLTGKVGPYAIGSFLIDDQAPGKRALPTEPLHGQRAVFGILRVSRDIFKQSTLGFIYTDREFETSFNRVAGLDGRFKLGQNWVATLQGVTSTTRFLDGSRLAGPAYQGRLTRSSRKSYYLLAYNDASPGFHTESGFVPRTDLRAVEQLLDYRFRPEGRTLIAWGPSVYYGRIWDHSGTRLDWIYDTAVYWELTGQTRLGVGYNNQRERLRPQDFPLLPEDRDFNRKHWGFIAESSYFRRLSFSTRWLWGQRIHFTPPAGQEPVLADWNEGLVRLTLRPLVRFSIENAYLLTHFLDRGSRATVLTNHILRSKWNWQFNRELSLRVIFQYNAVLANPKLTALETVKNFNADFLLTYLVNPWTALYLGYNSNAQNLDLLATPAGARLVHPPHRFRNDARLFFAKFSYLIRF